METAIRFSQNSQPDNTEQRFISVDVTNKSFKLCQATTVSKKASSVLEYDVVAASTKVPPFRAFDWHPHKDHENLIAVGQSSGEATLLSLIRPGESDPGTLSFQVRSQRPCNAVSLSSNHLLAAGLDRVRTDFCLNIWDFSQRLPSAVASTTSPKSPSFGKGFTEPLHKLAPGDAITSLKFFPTSPLHLIAGSKAQWVRLYDLREANSVSNSGLQFNTRCIHNLAIDPRDENFIASCSPSGDTASISLWDRRMMARSNSGTYSIHDTRQPEPSLELKNVVDAPGSIWSLRFSKSRRGCLGVLSSTGQLKMYDMGKDSVLEEFRSVEAHESEWEVQLPQEIFLDRSQDVQKPFAATSGNRDDKARIVSFDFTTSQDDRGQPRLITLSGQGEIRTVTPSAAPQPTILHPSGFLMHGHKYLQSSLTTSESISDEINAIKSKAEPRNLQRQAYSESKARGSTTDRKSSFDNQAWMADLGFHESTSSLNELISLTSLTQARCKNGYALDPTVNKKLTSNNKWLSGFWSWCSWAQQLHKLSALTQDNLDLSYLGVYSIWMEELPTSALATRSLGSSQYAANVRLSKTIEALVRRLQLPATRQVSTEYHFNRQLCLYISNLAWTTSELDAWSTSLSLSNKHSKAAFLALLSGNRSLAIRSLKAKGSNQTHHFMALAISTSHRKPTQTSTQDQSNLDSDDESDPDSGTSEDDTLRLSLLTDTLSTQTDPFARAILTFLKTTSWPTVLTTETSLPMRYRLALALRHLDDGALTTWISNTTTRTISAGDLEGINLTGTGTPQSLHLLQAYTARFTDLQTSVCALATTIPRYVRDPPILRAYHAMRQTYRAEIMSWGGDAMLDRVAFDVACARAARDNVTGDTLIRPPPPQVRLVCAACAGGLAHHEAGGLEESGGSNGGGGGGGEQKKKQPQQPSGAALNGSSANAATAAALGTVCPHCGRKMSRCGVCDGLLGQEDASYMKWFGKTADGKLSSSSAAADMAAVGEKMAGSVGTITSLDGRREMERNRSQKGSEGSKASIAGSAKGMLEGIRELVAEEEEDGGVDGEEKEREEQVELLKRQDGLMARFTVVCVKCSHGFHYEHARRWFEGDPEAGTVPHRFCPVPRCDCFCWEG